MGTTKSRTDNTLTKHLKEIPKIIWYPVAAIIHTLFGIVEHFYLKSINGTKRMAFERDHATKILRKSIRGILSSGSNVINRYNNKAMTKIFTFLLEAISFLTTYAGFIFFLGNVKPIAPLFMAIAVQGGCYFLMNYTSANKHAGNNWRVVLLLLLLSISVSTSYMGIFNGIIDPVEYIKTQYTSYQVVSNDLLDDYIESKDYIEIDRSEISEYFVKFSNLIDEADYYYKSQQKTINSQETTHYVRKNDVEEQTIDTNALSLKQNMQTELNQIRAYTETLKDHVKNISENTVFDAYQEIFKKTDALDKNDSQIKPYLIFQQAIADYRSLYKSIKKENKNDEEILPSKDVKQAIRDNGEKSKLNGLKLSDFDDLIKKGNNPKAYLTIKGLSTLENYISQMNAFGGSEGLSNAEKYRNQTNDAIVNNYQALYNLLDHTSQQQLSLAKKNSEIPNSQILPFIIPWITTANNNQREAIGVAVFSAIVACSIDILALLFSLSLLRKRESSLYYNHIENVKHLREEMVEDCLMYNCLNEIETGNHIQIDGANPDQINEQIALKINGMMDGFMNKIKYCYMPTVFNAFGYFSENDILGFSKEERNIFITLNNISMIKPFHRHELISVLNHDMSITENNNCNEKASQVLIEKYNSIFADDEIYYMVSKSVHAWFCDNFSELLENTIIFNPQTVTLFQNNAETDALNQPEVVSEVADV